MKRILRIEVADLFDTFDYSVGFNLTERITIIHGPNGYGKTTLLKLVNAVLNFRYGDLQKIPFREFSIFFDDNSKLSVKRALQENPPPKQLRTKRNRRLGNIKLDFEYYDAVSGVTENFTLQDVDEFDKRVAISSLGLYPLSSSIWRYEPTGEYLTEEEVVDRFGDVLAVSSSRNLPDWVNNLREEVQVRFIQSQRLLSATSGSSPSGARRPSMSLTVTTYAEEIAKAIQGKITEYAALSQALDRTFPARLVKLKGAPNLTDEALRKELSSLENKRSQLIAAGLLDQNREEDFQVSDEIDEPTRRILSVYITDVERKLSVFNDIASKIDLLKQIINGHFRYKQMSIDKDRGFIFSTRDKKQLMPEDLSTGEQHELILLYESLFKVKPGSLTLIDEPEISLHVEWQVQFLRDLEEIIKIAQFDVLIATHSPQIINDRWDLTFDLEEMNP